MAFPTKRSVPIPIGIPDILFSFFQRLERNSNRLAMAFLNSVGLVTIVMVLSVVVCSGKNSYDEFDPSGSGRWRKKRLVCQCVGSRVTLGAANQRSQPVAQQPPPGDLSERQRLKQ